MSETVQQPSLSFGLIAMIAAAIALLVSVAHISLGPFEKQPPVEQTIAETAVKIKDAAKRAITGKPAPAPEPEPAGYDLDIIATISILVFAGLAMLLSIVALFRRETRTPAYVGFSLGAGVLLMIWLQWIALIICGIILLVAIINNLESILP